MGQKQTVTGVWQPDQEVGNCLGCNVQFTCYLRKHHCRLCGKIMCHNCSRFVPELKIDNITKLNQRVCRVCHILETESIYYRIVTIMCMEFKIMTKLMKENKVWRVCWESGVNVRNHPSTESDILGEVKRGDFLFVLECKETKDEIWLQHLSGNYLEDLASSDCQKAAPEKWSSARQGDNILCFHLERKLTEEEWMSSCYDHIINRFRWIQRVFTFGSLVPPSLSDEMIKNLLAIEKLEYRQYELETSEVWSNQVLKSNKQLGIVR